MAEIAADHRHTRWSDPGPHAPRLRELPSDPLGMADTLEGFVIHEAVARFLGHEVPDAAAGDKHLRRTARLLDAAVRRDPRHLAQPRDIADHLYGTCHDFALLAVSAMRERGIPARLRVGFASYFRAGYWEDHWICEHRSAGRWAAFDPQLGSRARKGLGIAFDTTDMPPSAFRPAASVWRGLRAGELEPDRCGLSYIGIAGAWFVAASVLRDAAALAGIEALPWDYWGPARDFSAAHGVGPEQAREIDALAAALDPAPGSRAEAEAVLARFPWAAPTPTVLSFPDGDRRDVALFEA